MHVNFIKASKYIFSFKDTKPQDLIWQILKLLVPHMTKNGSSMFLFLSWKIILDKMLYSKANFRKYIFAENIILLTSEFNQIHVYVIFIIKKINYTHLKI
jgi:hypothetical protein